MLLLKFIIAVFVILSGSAQTTSPLPSSTASTTPPLRKCSSPAPTTRPLSKISSPSKTSVAPAPTPKSRTAAPAPTIRPLGKTSSPSKTSAEPAPTPKSSTAAPAATSQPNEKRATRKLSEDFELGLLKDSREKMTFLPYTPEERVFVAQQRQEILNIYANIEEKLKNYGVDSMASFSEILKNAANMTNKDFSYSMARHALSLRDLHTNFQIGGQHSCYFIGTPYQFDLVTSDDIIMNPQVVVRTVSQDPEYNTLFPTEALAIKPGDLLDKIDGKSFREYWVSVQNMTGGANQFGGYRQALNMLSSQNSRAYPLPTNNEVEFGFRQGTGESTIVKVPYVAQGGRDCLRTAPKERNTPPPPPSPPNPKDSSSDRAFPFPYRFAKYKYQGTKSDIVLQTTYKAKDFSMGVIRLDEFEDDNLTPNEVLGVIRTLLTDTLSNTDGILFDVRGNGGGTIDIAEGIYQWFAGKTEPVQTRTVNHPTNRIIFGNQSLATDQFRADRLALQSAAPTDKFAKPVGFLSVDQLNTDGHAYLKPVAVLTDGECYSACDFFCAGMQDSGAAIIFGEDPQTGAGGANVFDQQEALRNFAPTIFKPLPFEGSVGKDANNNTILIPGTSGMRVAIRQVVRIGRNAGKILEDTGVLVDEVIRQTPAEFAQLGGEVFPQFKHIAMRLKQRAAKDGRSNLQFLSPFGLSYRTNFSIPFSSSGFDRIEVRDSKGVLIVDQKLSSNSEGSKGELIATKKPALGWDRYNIFGFKGSQKMLMTKRPIVMLPDVNELPEIAAGTSMANPPLVLFNFDHDAGSNVAAPQDGWQKSQDGTLSIRPTTLDLVTARAVFPFKVGKGATLNIKADVQLETPANLSTRLSMMLFRYEPNSGKISNSAVAVDVKTCFTERIDFTPKNMTVFDSGFAVLVMDYFSPDISKSITRSASISNLSVSG
ncbi:hypothetical protein DFS34DRAFT_695811 [Phlyctochytrium arcticum]|nr:hypothetical protein DFS34DRAFT_695811 [Phlyctochytrium arcticum]